MAEQVTQADRDAAADFYGAYLSRPGEVLVTAHMRAAKIDESPLILAFARHRATARADALEEAARVADKHATSGIGSLIIGSAIRNLKGAK